jgi:ferredoxin
VHIIADRAKCLGSGQCVLTDPSIFDQGAEDGLVALLRPAPGEKPRPAAEEAAELCPGRYRGPRLARSVSPITRTGKGQPCRTY